MATARTRYADWLAAALVAACAVAVVGRLAGWAGGCDSIAGRDHLVHFPHYLALAAVGFDPVGIVRYVSELPVSWVHFPPGAYLVAGLIDRATILQAPAAFYIAQCLWLAVAVSAAYGIGRELSGRASGGVLLAALGGLSPVVVVRAAELNLDLAAYATAAAVLYLHLRTKGFRSRGMCLALGIAVGASLLVKTSNALVLGPYLALAWLVPLDGDETTRGARTSGALYVVVAAAVVCGWYYVPLVGRLLAETAFFMEMNSGNAQNRSMWLLGYLFPGIVHPALAALACVGAAILLRKRDRFLAWAAGSLAAVPVLLTAFGSESAGNLVPIALFAGMIAARGTRYLPPNAARAAALVFLAASVVPLLAPDAMRRAERSTAGRAAAVFFCPHDRLSAGSEPILVRGPTRDTDVEAFRITERLMANRYAVLRADEIGIVTVETVLLPAPAHARAHAVPVAAIGRTRGPRERRVPEIHLLESGGSPKWRKGPKKLVIVAMPADPSLLSLELQRALAETNEFLRERYNVDVVHRFRMLGENEFDLLFLVPRADGRPREPLRHRSTGYVPI